MKIIGISGSPKKKNSTTLFALTKAMEAIQAQNIETEILDLSQYNISGCIDCGFCRKKLDCSQRDDFKNVIIEKLNDSDVKGMILSSPVYFGGVTSQMKAFLDRCVMFRRNGFLFEDKIAGVLTVGRSRNGGQELAAMDLVKNCLIQGMIVVPDASPTSHFGGILWSGHADGVDKDVTGIKTAVNLGKKVAQIVKKHC